MADATAIGTETDGVVNRESDGVRWRVRAQGSEPSSGSEETGTRTNIEFLEPTVITTDTVMVGMAAGTTQPKSREGTATDSRKGWMMPATGTLTIRAGIAALETAIRLTGAGLHEVINRVTGRPLTVAGGNTQRGNLAQLLARTFKNEWEDRL